MGKRKLDFAHPLQVLLNSTLLAGAMARLACRPEPTDQGLADDGLKRRNAVQMQPSQRGGVRPAAQTGQARAVAIAKLAPAALAFVVQPGRARSAFSLLNSFLRGVSSRLWH
jgi:hypothetical protein